MKVRYMIDHVFDDARHERGLDPYVPCGVWVVGDRFDAGYLPGFDEREDEVNWLVNGWVEQGIEPWKTEGFLDYWRDARSPYRGMFGDIQTAEFEHEVACVKSVIDRLSGRPLENSA